MKRLLITLTAAMLVAGSLWAKDDEVIVTRQFTMSQRNSLPEKTITLEMKRLIFNKKADAGLTSAITEVMDLIAQEDYQNRTFVMLLENKASGETAIAVRSDDIVTRGKRNDDIYFGDLEHNGYHFVVLTGKDNQSILDETFKRQSKVKFVQEFEFVDFPTTRYPTNVIGLWSPDKGLKLSTVNINEDPNSDRNSFDEPAHAQE